MKFFIKIVLLIIITIAIYLIVPRQSDTLLYIPQKNSLYKEEAIELQNTPLSTYDLEILELIGVKSGWVRLNNRDTNLWKIYNIVLDSKREKSRKIVVFGGEVLSNILKQVAKQTNLEYLKLVKKYLKISSYNEGEILAKTYKIPFNASEDSIVSYLIYKSHSVSRKLLSNRDILIPSNSFKRYLTIASLIEKETQYYPEMPLISAVIHNRLKKDMRLQLDASLNYGKNRHKIVTHDLIKSDNSRYNTYKNKGLPPSPICSPSLPALEAALNPAKVDYLYFVKSGNKHIFSKNYKQHTIKVKEYKGKIAKEINSLISKKIKLNFPQVMPKYKINLPIK